MDIQYKDADDKYVVFAFIFMLSNQLQVIGDSFFKEVSTKQWFVLLVLDIMNGYIPTLNELSEAVGSSHQNVKQLVLKLEQRGYVELTKDETDARRLRIKPTPKCAELHAAYHEKNEIFMSKLFNGFQEEELSIAKKVLGSMREALERMKNEYVRE
jgi:DNA-binding MarR family transcriptional regulator